MSWCGIVFKTLFKWHGNGSWVQWTLQRVSEVHRQECLDVIPSVRARFRNVLDLMEDLLRVMRAASVFYFVVDSTSVGWSFSSAGVTGFQCPWKLARVKHDKWHGISDSKRMAAVFPGGTLEMPVGFWRQVEILMRQQATFSAWCKCLGLKQ